MMGAPRGLGARIGVRVAVALLVALVVAVALVAAGVVLVQLVEGALRGAEQAEAAPVAVDALSYALLVSVPALIVVVGVTTFLVVGRALRPVETIRTQLAAAVGDPARPLPEPVAHDEVARLAETVDAVLGRLEESRGAQRRLADLGHELRGPLAAVTNGLDLVQRGPVDRFTVAALRGEAERLARLVDGLPPRSGEPSPAARRPEPPAPPPHPEPAEPEDEQVTVEVPSSGRLPVVGANRGTPAGPDSADATTVITAVPRSPQAPRPMRDQDAREDPITAPRGIPVVRAGDTGSRHYPPTTPTPLPPGEQHGPAPAPRAQSADPRAQATETGGAATDPHGTQARGPAR
jgi:HAMP domain-containing protein